MKKRVTTLRYRSIFISVIVVLTSFSVANCNIARQSILYKDDNILTSPALLTVPPEFNLRPQASEIERNHGSITGGDRINATGRSTGISILLRAIGIGLSSPNIRALVDHEAAIIPAGDTKISRMTSIFVFL